MSTKKDNSASVKNATKPDAASEQNSPRKE